MNIFADFAAFKLKYPRVAALLDKSALALIIPAFLMLCFLDWPMAKTLFQWSLFAIVLSGVAAMISMLTFPSIMLDRLYKAVIDEKNVGAGLIAGAIILYVGLLVLSLVLWAKA